MRRRDFIKGFVGSAVVWPFAAHGQRSNVARIGALYIGLADAESFKHELHEGLRELGYVGDQNITFEFRSAEGNADRLPALAAELVRLKVDVIVALYVPSALAAKQATQDIPIVIMAADPVETGIVASVLTSRWKHYRRVSDVCRIECKNRRTVPRYATVGTARGSIRQRCLSYIRESYG
jgi:ABC transporter substrate binding protein